MNTHDPDRCLSGRDIIRNGSTDVVQCQGSVHHDGQHFFAEDHYTIRWSENANRG